MVSSSVDELEWSLHNFRERKCRLVTELPELTRDVTPAFDPSRVTAPACKFSELKTVHKHTPSKQVHIWRPYNKSLCSILCFLFLFYRTLEVLSRAHAKGEKAFTMISNQIQLALLLPLVSVPQWRPAPGAASMTAKGLNGRYLTDVKFDSLKSNISYTRQKNNEVVCQSVYVL